MSGNGDRSTCDVTYVFGSSQTSPGGNGEGCPGRSQNQRDMYDDSAPAPRPHATIHIPGTARRRRRRQPGHRGFANLVLIHRADMSRLSHALTTTRSGLPGPTAH
ncbi:hypothetical protein CDEST_08932 [Colletotrichum destructivum]|uniref:Uncharacterized protein n=1 Tax=Colletotrichum destructivum TaxID=34406 RepID=A0AAX4IMC8_9PEZI|nr:hypothetical protein CDEST_08932 [Colletotrichum destructivum]